MKTLLALLTVATLAVGVGPSAASSSAQRAETAQGSVRDKRGDAPKFTDITRVAVASVDDTLTVTFRVRQLSKSRRASFTLEGAWTDLYGDGSSWSFESLVETWTDRRNRVHVQVRWGPDEDAVVVECPGLRARWYPKRDTVRIVLPCGSLDSWGTTYAASSIYHYDYWDRRSYDGVKMFHLQ